MSLTPPLGPPGGAGPPGLSPTSWGQILGAGWSPLSSLQGRTWPVTPRGAGLGAPNSARAPLRTPSIHPALVKQGEDFMGRPDLPSFHYISNGQSLAFSSESGEVWKARRRLAQSALKSFSIAPSPTSSCSCLLEEHVSKEAEYLVTKFLQVMEEHKSFDLNQYVVVSVANVICAICFGKRYEHEDQELLRVVNLGQEFGEVAGSGHPTDFIPVLRYLPNRTLEAFKDINRRFNAFVQKIVQEHYSSFDKVGAHIAGEDAHVKLSDEKIIHIVNDLFGAGFDTVATALSWSLMYVALYPDAQKKIHEELATKSLLSNLLEKEENKETNGFCEVFYQGQEPIVPGLEPSAFRPERFLSASGTELNRAEGEKVLAFGLGRRRCLGETIGRWEIFLFLTTLLQQLHFSLRPGEPVDITPQYGLTMKYKKCEAFQIRQRFPEKSSL
uniref:unspecific monooxygenase n=1 Tax=Junco hyemalis TaxID=40217 RepID=A0A8C5JG51_JUNHY